MPRINFKEGVVMGHVHRSRYEVDHLLARLADDFPGDSYDLVPPHPSNNKVAPQGHKSAQPLYKHLANLSNHFTNPCTNRFTKSSYCVTNAS